MSRSECYLNGKWIFTIADITILECVFYSSNQHKRRNYLIFYISFNGIINKIFFSESYANPRTNRLVYDLSGAKYSIWQVRISEKLDAVFAIDASKNLRIWKLSTGRLTKTIPLGILETDFQIFEDNLECWLVSTLTVKIYDLNTFRLKSVIQTRGTKFNGYTGSKILNLETNRLLVAYSDSFYILNSQYNIEKRNAA